MTAPVVETPRLLLRGFHEGDLADQTATMSDPEVVRHLGAAPHNREETWRRLLTSVGLWTVFGYGYWAVERKEDGACIGHVGFADMKRDMLPSIEGLPEMGWIFARHAWGQGYAFEAVAAGLEWADRTLTASEIVAIIGPDNAPSIRLAERASFGVREEAVYKNEPILLFRRLRP